MIKNNGFPGTLVVFEGISCCGKTTIAYKYLKPYLESFGRLTHAVSEPTSDNGFGIAIRHVIEGRALEEKNFALLQHEVVHLLREFPSWSMNEVRTAKMSEFFRHLCAAIEKIEESVELSELERKLLFRADNYLNTVRTVGPALRDGKIVLQDRGDLSTLSYLPEAQNLLTAEELYEWCAALSGEAYIQPDVIFYFVVSPTESLERLSRSGKAVDMYESKLESLSRVASRYEHAISLLTEKRGVDVVRIDAGQPMGKVFSDVLEHLEHRSVIFHQ